MELIHKYEIEQSRAAMLFRHFEKIHERLITGELDFSEGDVELLGIGDQYDISMRSSLGYLVDSKYGIHLSWCSLQTLMHGEVVRYIADIDETKDGGDIVHKIVIECCECRLKGMFYSQPGPLAPEFNQNEIISHLIMKDLAEYPSVHCSEH